VQRRCAKVNVCLTVITNDDAYYDANFYAFPNSNYKNSLYGVSQIVLCVIVSPVRNP